MNQVAQEMEKATSDRARDLVVALNDPNQSTIIETKMDKRGGFYAANLSNRTIEYAYPSSIHATAAVKNPAKVAERMLHDQAHILRETEQPQWFLDRWSHMRAAMHAA